MSSGKRFLILSIFSRASVLAIILFIAYSGIFLNYKTGYNSSRLVGLSSGPAAKFIYQFVDFVFSPVGNSADNIRMNTGMTWSIKVLGIPFTDPIAGLSMLFQFKTFETGFFLGMFIPLILALIFGRIFCSYICPASLLFFSVSRIRNFLKPYFYLPEMKINRSLSWGILIGGIVSSMIFTHGIWIFILPYFAMGQTIFQGIAFGTVSSATLVLVFFSFVDLALGKNFTCRNLCPTGRLLGAIGSKSSISIVRDNSTCIEKCNICSEVCPLGVNPKMDETLDCSLCGECLVMCPANCLEIGLTPTGHKIKTLAFKKA